MSNSNVRTGLRRLARACFGFVILTVTLTLASSQVVLVQKKARPARASGKAKAKPKTKAQPAPPPAPGSETGRDVPLPLVSFVVTPPPLKAEPAEPANKPPIWPELLGYEFEVIKADARARIGERRKERARFYLESLRGGVNLEMVEIPAGTFLMGSSDAELERTASNYSRLLGKEGKAELPAQLQSEAPQHQVKVAGFYLGKYEVTQAQWRAVASLPKVNCELMSDPSHFKGGNRPVEQVSWEDATEFCERLSRATGRRYRLPTEAEWEYACRAGTNWPFSFGEAILSEWANYNGKLPYGQAPRSIHRQQTVIAGSLGKANAFGLYDMHGNVWEWCQDLWHESYMNAPADSAAWEVDGQPESRLLRGGAWNGSAGETRSARRWKAASAIRLSHIGFRVAADLEATPANK